MENVQHLEHTSLSSLSQHSEKVEVVVEHVEQQRGARRGQSVESEVEIRKENENGSKEKYLSIARNSET